MRTCVYLSYKGLGANLLHLAYCHEIAKKYGPITILTLCANLTSFETKSWNLFFLHALAIFTNWLSLFLSL